MHNVVVPIDGSAAALRALGYVLENLRGRAGARIHLINVQEPKLHVWPGKLVSPDMIEAEMRKEGAQILYSAETAVRGADPVCTSHVSIGDAGEKIVAYAMDHGCDSIAMGTRGMGVVESLVMGSVAQKVARLAPMPVTLVK